MTLLPAMSNVFSSMSTMSQLRQDQVQAVTQAWQEWHSDWESLVAAWENLEGCATVDTDPAQALLETVSPVDAEQLLSAFAVSKSPNRSREAWIDTASALEMTHCAPPRRTKIWLSEAEVVVDPWLGQRIAAETLALLIAAIPASQKHELAWHTLNTLYFSTRPELSLVLRSFGALELFVYRGRAYMHAGCSLAQPKSYQTVASFLADQEAEHQVTKEQPFLS